MNAIEQLCAALQATCTTDESKLWAASVIKAATLEFQKALSGDMVPEEREANLRRVLELIAKLSG